MQARYIKTKQDPLGNQIISLALGKLYICGNNLSGDNAHLIYGILPYSNSEDFAEELKVCGHTVDEFHFNIAIETDNFSEFNLTNYKCGATNIYLFDGIAVKVDQKGISFLCKPNITLADINETWPSFPKACDYQLHLQFHTPNDEIEKLAVAIEQLGFFTWYWFERNIGEMYSGEERLESINTLYNQLSNGRNLDGVVKDIIERLSQGIEDCNVQILKNDKHLCEIYQERLENAKQMMVLSQKILANPIIIHTKETDIPISEVLPSYLDCGGKLTGFNFYGF